MFTLYTDGGALGNPGVGGYGYVILKDDDFLLEGGGYSVVSTNNKMEIKAVIEGLRKIPDNSYVQVFTDSDYVIKTMKGLFGIKKNQYLWEALNKEVERMEKVEWNWVKGHAGIEYNERCDKICKQMMKGIVPKLKEINKAADDVEK